MVDWGALHYNLTGLDKLNNLFDVFKASNDFTGKLLVTLFVVALFFVFTLLLKSYELVEAIMASAWICTIIALMLSFTGLLDFWFVIIFLTIGAFFTFYQYVTQRG